MTRQIDAYAITDGNEILINGVGSSPAEAAVNLGFSDAENAAKGLHAIPVTVSTSTETFRAGKMNASGFALVIGDKIFANGVAKTAGHVSRSVNALELTPLDRGSYDILDVLVTERG